MTIMGLPRHLAQQILRARVRRAPSLTLPLAALVHAPKRFVSVGTSESGLSIAISTAARLGETVLKPINARLLGPLDRSLDQTTPLPMVLVLGNHSSGKSSFINYVIGRPVQTTGVAPTDDGFSFIAPGTMDLDQSGPALVGDDAFGLSGLRTFGNGLINRLSLKVRRDLAVNDIMLVDSPGMIDSPLHSGAVGATDDTSRGYDFPATVKYLADRADVILLFVDPHKPGTSGETLRILTTSLRDSTFKLLLVLNKCDVFHSAIDFARSYGALTWNLSKVLYQKDLVRIYTCALPAEHTNQPPPTAVLQDAMADLEAARNELVAEVRRAPLRRVDNLVTRLYDSARVLKMHAVVMAGVRKEYSMEVAKAVGSIATGALGFGGLAASLMWMGSFQVGAPLAALTVLGVGAGSAWSAKQLEKRADWYINGGGLDEVFRRAHYVQLAEQDEFVKQLWDRVRPQLQTAFRTMGIRGAPAVKRSELADLDRIIDVEVPELRKASSKARALTEAGTAFLAAAGGRGVGGAAAAAKPPAGAAAAGLTPSQAVAAAVKTLAKGG